MLWAHAGEEVPRVLPISWQVPNGQLYTGFNNLADSDSGIQLLNDFGWFPVVFEDLPIWTYMYGPIYFDNTTNTFVVPAETITDEEKLIRVKTIATAKCREERNRRLQLLLGDGDQQLYTLTDAVSLLNLVASGVELTPEQLYYKNVLEDLSVVRYELNTAMAEIISDIDACTAVSDVINIIDTISVNPLWG